MLRKFCMVLVAAALVFTVPGGKAVSDDFPLEYAVIKVGSGCSGVVIGPRLAMTASHCVPRLQSKLPVQFYEGSATEGRIIWDSYYLGAQRKGLDVAFFVLDLTWPYFVELKPYKERCLKNNPCIGWTSGFSGGIHYWDEYVKVIGPYFIEGYGSVYVYRGDLLPGASGSAVFLNRQIIGLVTNGTTQLSPPFVFGATAERLWVGLSDLVRLGEMKWCKTTVKTPKGSVTREEVCPR